MKSISIGTSQTPLKIDVSILSESRGLITGNSGAGKSYLLRKIIEQCAPYIQIIVFDSEGEFVSLREKYDFALVGHDGEVSIDIRSAKLLAHKLIETNTSAIINLSDLDDLTSKREYIAAFLTSMMNLPRKDWHPLLVVIDEAHRFCPEKGDVESTRAIITLMDAGRKRGFAGILATQRLSKLHKDAAAEANNIFIGRIWLDNDKERAADLLGIRKADAIKLRDFPPGTWEAFGPALDQKGVIHFTCGRVETTHPEPGNKHAMKAPAPSQAIRDLIPVFDDLPKAAAEEESEILRLRKINSDLTRRLSERPTVQIPEPEIIRVPIFQNGDIDTLKQTSMQVDTNIKQLLETMEYIQRSISAAGMIPAHIISNAQKPPQNQTPQRPMSFPSSISTKNAPSALPEGERKILTACAQYPDGASRDQLTALTGYKRSTRDAYISRLQGKNAIQVQGKIIFATEDGMAMLGSDFEPLPTGYDLQRYWMNCLPSGEKEIFGAILKHYPNTVKRDDLTMETKYKRSTRDAYISRLQSKRLVIITGPGYVAASDNLFN